MLCFFMSPLPIRTARLSASAPILRPTIPLKRASVTHLVSAHTEVLIPNTLNSFRFRTYAKPPGATLDAASSALRVQNTVGDRGDLRHLRNVMDAHDVRAAENARG